MSAVERSAESAQQSVRMSTWCETNQAAYLQSPSAAGKPKRKKVPVGLR